MNHEKCSVPRVLAIVLISSTILFLSGFFAGRNTAYIEMYEYCDKKKYQELFDKGFYCDKEAKI